MTWVGWAGKAITIYAKTETKLLPAKTQRLIECLIARLNPAEKGSCRHMERFIQTPPLKS